MATNERTKADSLSFQLFPLPYFSILRAADQLQVSEDYIVEAIKCGVVRACVLFDSKDPEHSESGVIGDALIFNNTEIKFPSSIPADNELVGNSPFDRVTTSNLDKLISTNASQAVVTNFRLEEKDLGFVSAYLHGFWQIGVPEDSVSVLELEGDDEAVIEVFPYCDDVWYQTLTVEPESVRVTGFLVNVRKDQLVLSYHDVRSLLHSYKTGVPLNQLGYFGETQSLPLSVNMKRSPRSVGVMIGLIASHPELGGDILANKSDAHSKIEKLFARKGISLGGLWPDRKTFSEWLRHADLSRMTFHSKK